MTATEPVRAPGTPGEWPAFVAEVAQALAGLGPGESLVLEVVPEGALGASSYYVQFAPQPDGLRAEAVSNAFLPEFAQLTPVEMARVEKLGWQAPDLTAAPGRPTPGTGSPNFWRDWPAPVSYEDVADLAVATLRQVYGASTPLDVRLERVAAGAQVALAPPADSASDVPPEATIESVRAQVEQAIHDFFDIHEVKKDEHGDLLPFEFGSAAVQIRVYGDPPVVQVLAPLVTDLSETPELIAAVNELNLNVSFAKIVWTGAAVVASIEMFAAPFTPLHLSHAFSVIGAIADDHGHLLQQRFGGRMGSGTFVPPPTPSRVGGYL